MPEKKIYYIAIAGQQIACEFRFPDTAKYFHVLPSEAEKSQAFCYVQEQEILFWERMGNPFNAFAEYSLLSVRISDKLLEQMSCLFHAVSFLHNGKAWLITAAPGTGKSTQYKFLKQFHPDGFEIICGDKPVLEFKDNAIVVHPSPWNGKEGWAGNKSGILEGIILLSRSTANSIEKIKSSDAVFSVYASIIQSAETEQIVTNACRMADKILRNCKVWSMTTNTVPDSTHMLYERVFSIYE